MIKDYALIFVWKTVVFPSSLMFLSKTASPAGQAGEMVDGRSGRRIHQSTRDKVQPKADRQTRDDDNPRQTQTDRPRLNVCKQGLSFPSACL